MKRITIFAILTFSILLTACGANATSVPTESPVITTATPDLCSSTNLPAEVTKVHKLMREFDDYSALASNTPKHNWSISFLICNASCAMQKICKFQPVYKR